MKSIVYWFTRGGILTILFYVAWLGYWKLAEVSNEFFGFFSQYLFGKPVKIVNAVLFIGAIIFIGFLTSARFTKNHIFGLLSPLFMRLLKSIPVYGKLFSRKPFLAPYWGQDRAGKRMSHTASIASIVEKEGGGYEITIAFWHLPPLMLQCEEGVEVKTGISTDEALSFSFGGGIPIEIAKTKPCANITTLGELIRREGYVNMIQPAS